jgi:rhamnosyltransferase
MKRLAVYMFYDSAGVVADYVIHKLKKLRDHVETIVVVANGQLTADGKARLSTVADTVHVRENFGFDVWAYRDGLVNVVGWEKLTRYDELLLLNYTFYAPIFPFKEMFDRMSTHDVDFWGITGFRGPVPNGLTGEGILPFHIQSHFIAVRRRLFCSRQFRNYWEEMPPITSYIDSILKHEVRFTEHFEAMGYRYSVYADPMRYQDVHPALNAIDQLLDDRIPILKRRPFFHDPLYLDQQCVDLDRVMELVKKKSDFDTSLVWKDMTRVAKPRDLYTNATLLQVMPDEAPPTPPPARRIAVLAHAYFPALLGELMSYAANIPQPFDVYVTTSDETKKAEVEAWFAKNPGRYTLKEARVVTNRGRDVSAHLIGLRDVVLTGGYDYLCRLHSKVSPQDPFAMARHFKEHLFENLLAGPGYVARLLSHFEANPTVGMIMPPVIHQGYPTLGHAWFTNRPGAAQWAKKIGIDVAFDDDTPLAAYGSMYWYRPAALKKLFAYPFTWDDFPQEPDYGDGRLPHILERLIAYTAFSSGFTVHCALTTKNAAKSYVKLEYKLQRMIGDQNRLKHTAPLPLPQLKEFVRSRMQAQPHGLAWVTKSYRAIRAGYHFAKKLRAP